MFVLVLLLDLLLTAAVVDSIGSYQYLTTKNGVNVKVIQNQLLPGVGAVVVTSYVCDVVVRSKTQ